MYPPQVKDIYSKRRAFVATGGGVAGGEHLSGGLPTPLAVHMTSLQRMGGNAFTGAVAVTEIIASILAGWPAPDSRNDLLVRQGQGSH